MAIYLRAFVFSLFFTFKESSLLYGEEPIDRPLAGKMIDGSIGVFTFPIYPISAIIQSEPGLLNQLFF